MQSSDQKEKASGKLAGRLATVDMLRGMAALAVVIYHARQMLWCGTSHLVSEAGGHASFTVLAGYALSIFSLGWLGVPLFFVLSGYCIHRSYARRLKADSTLPVDWREYALRRLWRIYPVYLGALALTAATDCYVRAYAPQWHAPGDVNSIFTLLASVLSLQCITAPLYGSNHVFWTLSIELHFYAVYPLLLYLSRRVPRRALLFALAASVVYMIVDNAMGIKSRFVYHSGYGSPVFVTYWFVWAAGMYLADVEAGRERVPSWALWLWLPAGILGLVLKALHVTDFDWLCWGCFFAGLLYTLNRSHFSWGKVGSILSAVGVFSYSLYATHRCILELAGIFLVDPRTKPISLWPMIAGVSLSIVFAWLFFQAIERWSLRVPGRGAAKPSAVPAEQATIEPQGITSHG